MLNYNYNWIEPLQKSRNFFKAKVDWVWRRSVTVATGAQSGSDFVFGTGSITYVPYAPNQFFVSGGFETGSLLPSGSALGLPVYLSVTGSAAQAWPVTGSNTLYINVGGNLGFNQSTSSILSYSRGNLNQSGSAKISSSFAPLGNQQYNIDFGITHTKGNIYNSLINWSAVKTSPFGNNIKVNGELSASFNIVKNTSVNNTIDQFTNVAFIKEVSGSAQSSSFYNDYSYSVTASYTASINNVTGSTTMSFVCTEEGLNVTKTFFNPNTTIAIGSASFVASNDTTHNLVTSVNYNKGNIANSIINWYVTGSAGKYLSSSSLNITKDANVTMVSQSLELATGSQFTNDYAFNQTASLLSNYRAYLTNDSSSIKIAKINLEIGEIGFTSSKWISASCETQTNSITSSFEAQTNIPQYNITASLIEYTIPVFKMQVTASGAGGGGGAGLPGTVSGGGGGGMAVSSSIIIVPNVLYTTFVPTGSNIGSDGGDAYMLGYNNCPNISYNMYAGGGKPGVTGNLGSSGFANGGASGTGSIVQNGTTIATYNSFAGGTGSYAGGPYVQQSAGGGASNTAVGGNGDASGTSAQQGGDGASGYTAGGGGSCLGNSPAPPPPGRNGYDGTGFTGQGGQFNTSGQSGSLFIKYAGTGSKFVSTNAFISYDAINDITTYAFSTGSGTFIYIAQPTI
jgi:hypothetical protein